MRSNNAAPAPPRRVRTTPRPRRLDAFEQRRARAASTRSRKAVMESASLGLALTQPWLLARVLASLLALALLLAALPAAVGLGRGDGRRAELVSALLTASLRVELAALALSVFAAQRLVDAVPGAMCAYGVVHASPWGERAVVGATVGALVCAAGTAVAAVDARMRYGSVHRALRAAVVAGIAATGWDLWASALFATTLDLDVGVTCCTREVAEVTARVVMGATLPAATAALAALGALGVTLSARRRPGIALALGALSWPAMALSTRDGVAPYVLGNVDHRCVYCAAAALPFGALAVGALVAGALLLARGITAMALRRAEGAGDAAEGVLRATARAIGWTALAWLVAAVGATLAWRVTHGTFGLE